MCIDVVRATPAVIAAAFVSGALTACTPDPQPLGHADYKRLGWPRTCSPGSRDGPAGTFNGGVTERHVRYAVRTPSNYDPSRAHPLLMVYAPAGFDTLASERLSKLTTEWTTAGFVVAYADNLPLGMRAFDALGEVPARVAARWCIDAARIHYVGHSDGGTTSMAITFLDKGPAPVAVIASAAGIRKQDLDAYRCPKAVPIAVIHSREDDHFPPPAYGRGAAEWWAACNGCRLESESRTDGCVAYQGCRAATWFCETTGSHARWPRVDAAWRGFLLDAAR